MAGRPAIEAKGFNQFRRDVKRADKTVAQELQAELREVARGVATEAAGLAPRGEKGALAGGYRGAAAGGKGVVRNRVFYSRFIEFGFHPGGGSRFVEGQHPIGRAIERREDEIVDGLGDAVERAAARLGWH